MMDTISFSATSVRHSEQIQLSTTAQDLSDVLETFERFLRGAGYVFDGHITIDLTEPNN